MTDLLVKIRDLTVGNKNKKIEALNKSLHGIPTEYVKKDLTQAINDIDFVITNIEQSGKIDKAIDTLSFTLDTSTQAPHGDTFVFTCQKELTEKFDNMLLEKTKNVYSYMIKMLSLPDCRILKKSNDNLLRRNGKILYDCETGQALTMTDYYRLVQGLDKFITGQYGNIGDEMILSSEVIGRMMSRLAETQSLEALRKKHLNDMKYKNRSVDWISASTKRMRGVFKETLDRNQLARIQTAKMSCCNLLTNATTNLKHTMTQVVIDGIKRRDSKSVVSQNLFDRCVKQVRDFYRIADTEIQNNVNSAYIQEEVYKTTKNAKNKDSERAKVYFRRFELSDDNTCKKCLALRGKIALYSDFPLDSEAISDEIADMAIWQGSDSYGTLHPYCRGSWYRYFPDNPSLAQLNEETEKEDGNVSNKDKINNSENDNKDDSEKTGNKARIEEHENDNFNRHKQ